MRNIADWLQANGITCVTVAPDWMFISCGYMTGDAHSGLDRTGDF